MEVFTCFVLNALLCIVSPLHHAHPSADVDGDTPMNFIRYLSWVVSNNSIGNGSYQILLEYSRLGRICLHPYIQFCTLNYAIDIFLLGTSDAFKPFFVTWDNGAIILVQINLLDVFAFECEHIRIMTNTFTAFIHPNTRQECWSQTN